METRRVVVDVRRSIVLAVATERRRLIAEMLALRAESTRVYEQLMRDFVELQTRLQAAHAKLDRLEAVQARSCGQYEDIAHTRALAAFAMAQREGSTLH